MANINRDKLIPYLEAYKRYLDAQIHDEIYCVVKKEEQRIVNQIE